MPLPQGLPDHEDRPRRPLHNLFRYLAQHQTLKLHPALSRTDQDQGRVDIVISFSI